MLVVSRRRRHHPHGRRRHLPTFAPRDAGRARHAPVRGRRSVISVALTDRAEKTDDGRRPAEEPRGVKQVTHLHRRRLLRQPRPRRLGRHPEIRRA